MVSLTSSIAKTYHFLFAKRLTKFLTANNYIDEKVQKAFLPSINGSIEHNVILEDITSQAKTNLKTFRKCIWFSAPPSHNTYPEKV